MDRPETLPSMFRREATLLLVAFFCPAVLCFLRAGPSTVSSSNPSAEDGDVKIAQKTYRMEHENKKRVDFLRLTFKSSLLLKKYFSTLRWLLWPVG